MIPAPLRIGVGGAALRLGAWRNIELRSECPGAPAIAA